MMDASSSCGEIELDGNIMMSVAICYRCLSWRFYVAFHTQYLSSGYSFLLSRVYASGGMPITALFIIHLLIQVGLSRCCFFNSVIGEEVSRVVKRLMFFLELEI